MTARLAYLMAALAACSILLCAAFGRHAIADDLAGRWSR